VFQKLSLSCGEVGDLIGCGFWSKIGS